MYKRQSPESLKEYWGFDNSTFTGFLKSKGFHVLRDAHSNADFTPLCIATALNMDYAPIFRQNIGIPAQVEYLSGIIRQAECPERLQAAGYELVGLSLFPIPGTDRFYRYPKIGASTLLERVTDKFASANVLARLKPEYLAEVNLDIISRLQRLPSERRDQPRFIYAHLMMPHDPYLFDRSGNRVRRGLTLRTLENKDHYLDQLIFVNSLLTNVVTRILEESTVPPVIVIQGDHGFRHLSGADRKEESTRILNAVYVPGIQEGLIYDGMTPVNTFRVIFNSCFGEQYEILPDKQHYYLNEAPEQG